MTQQTDASDTTTRSLELHKDGDRVRLVFRGRIVVDHTPKRPFLWVGTGAIRYDDSHAHYTIRPLRMRRRRCRTFSIREDTPSEGEERALLLVSTEGAAVRFAAAGRRLHITFPRCEPHVSNVWLHLAVAPDEHFYGG
ncbi:MAG: hypothetical protein ACLFM6_05450, partial [Spirochaetaceae bacterium]